jgi:tetratricopeptide (TPR) repeat protein
MRTWCRIITLATLLVALRAGELGNRPPLDESQYLQVPSWFAALPAAPLQHLAPAAVVAGVDADSPASAAGLAIADRLIALDGRRVHDLREIRLLRSAMSYCHDQETWTIERGQDRLTLTVTGLDPFRISGATLIAPGDEPDCVALLAPLGVAFPAADAQALRWLPARISHAFASWMASPSGTAGSREARWIGEWVAAYLHVLRGEPVAAASVPVPEPFLAAVDRFHRAIAAMRAAGRPDFVAAKLGCDPWFCALFYPYPAGTAPAFGTPTLSPPLAALLRRLYDDPLGCWPQGHFAVRYAKPPALDMERFLGEVAGFMIESPTWVDWLNRYPRGASVLDCWEPAQHEGRMAELRHRFEAQGADADVAGVALAMALVSEKRCDEANQLTAALAVRSPYLAWRARNLGMVVARIAGTDQDLAALADDARRHPYAEPAPFPEIYQKCMENCPSLARMAGNCDAEALHGLPAVFRARPDLVAAGLDRLGGMADQDRWMSCESCSRGMNNAAWRIATCRSYADGELATMCAHMILSISQGGDGLDLNTKDTVAACLARAGDFANAQRIEQEAIADLPPLWPVQLADFTRRLELYRQQQPAEAPGGADEPVGDILEASVSWPGGAQRAVGHTCAGMRIGRWRFFSATGILEATCNYRYGAVDGPCRSYYPDGTIAAEAFLAGGGKRIGRWRTWHANGMPACDASYIIDGGNQHKSGEWLWFDPSGRRCESGSFSNSQRSGSWSAWDPAGRRIGHADFISGSSQSGWAGSEVPTEPGSPEPAPATAAEFLARAAARNLFYEMAGTIADYNRAIELQPDLATAWAGRAKAHEDMGDHQAAITDASRAIVLAAADPFPYRIRGAALEGGGDHEGAIRDFTTALTLSPRDAEVLTGRGASRDATGDHAGAIADCTAAIGLKPDGYNAYFIRGVARRAAGLADGAFTDFTMVVAHQPSHFTASINLAEVKGIRGDHAGALADMTALIAKAPSYGELFIRRGQLQQSAGATAEALSDFTRAITLNPGDSAAYQARGAFLADLGRLPGALEDFRKVLDQGPPDSPYLGSARLRVWLIRSRLGEGKAAVKELQDHLGSRPAGAGAAWPLPLMLFAVGMLSEGEVLASVQGQAPSGGAEHACAVHFYLGAKHLLAGEQAVAVSHFEACIATGCRDISEYRSAQAELASLARQRK